ncbi:hypothetical protein [Candidatus Nitrosopumilus sediminis]|uniref:hypothetical protein n=1 Tax=Candidatus Nitrosopumilus sediminis TaxID=1229909 RepID=UPI000A435A21|nr:hypothetical protein [Candidatus Nitrosopumilus sediminis]
MRIQQCQRCKGPLSDDDSYCPQCNWKKSRHVIPEPMERQTKKRQVKNIKI